MAPKSGVTSQQSESRLGWSRTEINWSLTVLLAIVPVLATLVSTLKGPGLSPDSVTYLSAGLNLADGDGLISFSGETVTVFPPGLPLLIAMGDLVGVGASWTVRLLNAGSFAAIVFLSAVLLHRHVVDRRLAQVATLFVSVSVAVLGVAKMAWTEPLFVVLTLLFLLGLEGALADHNRTRWVAGCSVLVWVSFLVRYAGISLIAIGGATLLLGLWRLGPLVAGRFAFAFAALSAIGPVAWMLRNHVAAGTLMGPRSPSEDTLAGIAGRIALTVGGWLVPVSIPGELLAVLGVGFLVALIGGSSFVLWTSQRTEGGRLVVSLLPVVVFGFVYVVYLIAAQLTTAFDQVNSRLLIPIFVPLVVVVCVVLEQLLNAVSTKLRRVAVSVLMLAVVLQGVSFVNGAVSGSTTGVGYASSEWKESELVAVTGRLPTSAVIYSSTPDGIWAVTRREPVMLSPRLNSYRSSRLVDEIPPAFLRDAACSEAYLAWFDDARTYLRTPEQLSEIATLEPLARTSDGTLYRLGSKDGADCSDTVE